MVKMSLIVMMAFSCIVVAATSSTKPPVTKKRSVTSVVGDRSMTVRVDSLYYERGMPQAAKEAVKNAVIDSLPAFLARYEKFVARCTKCGGEVTLTVFADSNGVIDSSVVSKVSARIVDRKFLDELPDCLPAMEKGAVKRYAVRANIVFKSTSSPQVYNAAGRKGALAAGLVCALISIVFNIIRISASGGM